MEPVAAPPAPRATAAGRGTTVSPDLGPGGDAGQVGTAGAVARCCSPQVAESLVLGSSAAPRGGCARRCRAVLAGASPASAHRARDPMPDLVRAHLMRTPHGSSRRLFGDPARCAAKASPELHVALRSTRWVIQRYSTGE